MHLTRAAWFVVAEGRPHRPVPVGVAVAVEGPAGREVRWFGRTERPTAEAEVHWVWGGKAFLRVLRSLGASPPAFVDLHLLRRLLAPEAPDDLETVVRERTGRRLLPREDLLLAGPRLADVPERWVARWAAERAEALLEVGPALEEEARQWGLDAVVALEHELLPVVEAMERAGIRVDLDAALAVAAERRAECEAIARRLSEIAGRPVAPTSRADMEWLFSNGSAFPAPRRKLRGARWRSPPRRSRRGPGWRPWRPSFATARPRPRRRGPSRSFRTSIPPTAGPCDLSSDRDRDGPFLSSDAPAIQFLRRSLKHLLVPSPGRVFVRADYSQVEMRVMAHLSADPVLAEILAAGRDLHAETAAAITGRPVEEIDEATRQMAKAVNFGVAYGQTAKGLARSAGIPEEEAERFIRAYFERFAGLAAYLESVRQEAPRLRRDDDPLRAGAKARLRPCGRRGASGRRSTAGPSSPACREAPPTS